MTRPIDISIEELVLPADADPAAVRAAVRAALLRGLAGQGPAGGAAELDRIIERTAERITADSLAALPGGPGGRDGTGGAP